MGLLDYLSKKVEEKIYQRATSMVGYTPSFSQFGDNIMNDDTVKTITNIILDEYSKLNPRHIRTYKSKQVDVTDDNINYVLNNPNRLMTKSDFLRKIAYLRNTYDNAFIYPTYDLYINERTGQTKKVYKALYPLHVNRVDFYEDEEGTLYVDFTFPNGQHSGQLLYNEVIHWRKDYGMNEYMGGGKDGFPDNTSLLKYLQTNDKLIQSTFKSIESSLKVNGILKIGGLINNKDRESARIEFEKQLESNENGILSVDTGADYIPIPYNGRQVNPEILKFYDTKIRNHFRTSQSIVDGDYTNEQKEAFYESALEEGIISLGQAFSRVMLTNFARRNGNEIIFYSNRIQMMSADKKIRLAELLLPVAGTNANTVLSWFGEPPVEGGDEYYMSLNYVKAKDASKYQVGETKESEKMQIDNKNASNSDIIKTEENQTTQKENQDDK